MSVTIQDIAEAAGVSRGTVDRALNGRGRISPQVEARVKRIAKELGYVKKERRSNAASKKRLRIGIVTLLARASFMQEINRGIERAGEELKERNIELLVREGLSVDEDEQLDAIEELVREGVDALAIMPVDRESIRVKINWLIETKRIPVITFNSDIIGTKRCCYVGMDNKRSGRAAAGLIGMLTGGTGKVLVITGYFSNHVDNSRVDGFVEELRNAYPGLELAGVQGSFDDAAEVEKIITHTMLSVPGVNGILLVSGGQEGVARSFETLKLENCPHTVIYDLTPENSRLLQSGQAEFLIDQDGYMQGHEPPLILADLLQKNRPPEKEFVYTEIRIKTKYNLPDGE